MRAFLISLTDRLLLDRPRLALIAMGLMTLLFAVFIPRFQLDASADSLLLEDDRDLSYYSSIVARYGSDDFLVVTYTAGDELFSEATLADIQTLRNEIRELPSVESVISMLDVPLIDSPRVTISELQKRRQRRKRR